MTEVHDLMSSLDVNKGAGSDGIPSIFIKNCAMSLSNPLSIIYNKSLAEGQCPSIWKKALIVPVFKSGNRNSDKSYRPISKLCIFEKIFEKIIYKYLFAAFKKLINIQQHGFYNGRSVESNLVEYTDYILQSMDCNTQVDAVYPDPSKAFDRINHSILIKKLERYGIHGNLLKWFISYLDDRQQCVTVKGFRSD